MSAKYVCQRTQIQDSGFNLELEWTYEMSLNSLVSVINYTSPHHNKCTSTMIIKDSVEMGVYIPPPSTPPPPHTLHSPNGEPPTPTHARYSFHLPDIPWNPSVNSKSGQCTDQGSRSSPRLCFHGNKCCVKKSLSAQGYG